MAPALLLASLWPAASVVAQNDTASVASPSSTPPISLKLDSFPQKVGDGLEQESTSTAKFTYRYSRLGAFLAELHANVSAHLDSIERVIAVDDHQQVTKYRIFVKALTAKIEIPAKLKKLAAEYPSPDAIRCQGAMVVIKLVPELTFAREDGRPLTEADRVYLSMFYHSESRRTPERQAVFDPDHPVSPGDTWTVDPTLASSALSAPEATLDPTATKVSASYDARRTVLGCDAATVTITAHSDSVTSSEADALFDDPTATLDLTATLIVPVNGMGSELFTKTVSTFDTSGLSKDPRMEGLDMEFRLDHTMDWKLVRRLP